MPVAKYIASDGTVIPFGLGQQGSVGATGLKGDKGDKGDPGGLVAATIIATGTDLNTITTPGTYRFSGTVNLVHNGPRDGANGFMVVYHSSGVTLQELTEYGGVRWLRRASSNNWDPWKLLHTTGSVGGGDLTGTGMPQSVVSAPVGTYYTDTAGTNGAWRWLKKTGTGNTGWEVIHGDTGWRNITTTTTTGVVTGDSLPASLTASSGSAGRIDFRRVGDTAYFRMRGLTMTGSTVQVPIPFGWRPGGQNYSTELLRSSSTTMVGMSVGASILYMSPFNSATPIIIDPTFYCATDWSGLDGWPAVLPGTPG